jgi:hypothetical protein
MNNKSTALQFLKCVTNRGYEISLTPGQFYQRLPDKAEAHGMVRVIDNTGEDYLFDADLFEEVNDLTRVQAELTVGLTAPMKAMIYQIANERGVSMSSLIREWIDERLDLPVATD